MSKEELRKIDEKIEQTVFGRETFLSNDPFDYIGKNDAVYLLSKSPSKSIAGAHTVKDVPRYSTDISSAWQVLVHLCGPQTPLNVRCLASLLFEGNLNLCEIHPMQGPHDSNFSSGQVDSMPLAICLAALKSKGVEV